MHLTQTAEYALRAMTLLAQRRNEEVGIRALDLAEEVNVPLPYLQKILRRLVVSGLLESKKGRGGGFRLLVPPREISFRAILSAADGVFQDAHCAFGWKGCDPVRPCPLHPVWAQLNDSITRWAETTTLADVLVPRGKTGPKRRRRD